MKTWRAAARHMELLDEIHASADLPVVKPKHEMTDRGCHPRCAFVMVRDELTLDGNSRRKIQRLKNL